MDRGRIIGIDPGTRNVGYGIVENRGRALVCLASGCVRAPDCRLAERLVAIFRGLREIMDRFPPSAAAVETVFAGKNPRTALAIGEGRGVALLAAAERGVEVFGYEPALIKRAVTGSGRADKDQVRRMVRILLGLPEPPETDHAADALALAITHTRHLDGNGWLGRTAREPAGRGRLPEAILRQLPSVAASGRGGRGRV